MAEAEVSLWQRRRLLVIDWAAAGQLVAGLVDDIRASRFEPDVVVGIARGGLPLAVALSHQLGVADFRVLAMRRNSSDSRYSERGPVRLDCLSPDKALAGRRILLADDIVGDGGTLAAAVNLLTAAGLAELRTAALVRNVHATVRPDYEGVTADDWTVFPWENPPGPHDPAVALTPPHRDPR